MAAGVAEEGKAAHYAKRHVIPEVVAIAIEAFGTMGREGDAHLRKVLREFVRPVHVFTGGDGKIRFVDHGARYAIFLRRLREQLAVALQLGNFDLISEWHRRCLKTHHLALAAAAQAAAGAGAAGAGGN